MQQQQNEFTGNNIPVNINQLVDHVHQELERHDDLVRMTNNEPNYSPYTNPILFTTGEGQQVQVPQDIQQQAIKMWVESKQHEPEGNSDGRIYAQANQQYKELQETPEQVQSQEEVKPESQESTQTPAQSQPIYLIQNQDNTYFYLLLVIAGVGVMYYLYKNNKF